MLHLIHNGFKKPTKEAEDLKDELQKHGVKVYVEVNDGHKHVDLGLPDAKLNIEIDGIQHLTNPQQIATDLARGYYSNETPRAYARGIDVRNKKEPLPGRGKGVVGSRFRLMSALFTPRLRP